MKANYPGRCSICADPFPAGASVVNRDGGWCHRRCADTTVTAVSDRCGVPTSSGRPCRNPVKPGDQCAVHGWDAPKAVRLAVESRQWAGRSGPVVQVQATRCECGEWMRPGVDHECKGAATG